MRNGVAHGHAGIGEAAGRNIDLGPTAFATVQRPGIQDAVIERVPRTLRVFVATHDAHVSRAERWVEERGVGPVKK